MAGTSIQSSLDWRLIHKQIQAASLVRIFRQDDIAKIDDVEVAETWTDFLATIRTIRGQQWLNKHKPFLLPLRREWSWVGKEKVCIFFLSTPRLVFNPPVLKENLQKGYGWLSKRFFSFDTLFRAWSC